MDAERLKQHQNYSWQLLLEQMRQHGLTHEQIAEVTEIVRSGIRIYGGRPKDLSKDLMEEFAKPRPH